MKPSSSLLNTPKSSDKSLTTPFDHLDAAVTPEIEADCAVELIKASHAQEQAVCFDFEETEFTRAYPDWKEK